MIGAQLGDSEQLRAQTLASLQRRGLVMNQGVAGYPAVNDGVAAVYCSPDTLPQDCQINAVRFCWAFDRPLLSRDRPAPGRFRACAQHTQGSTAQQMPLDVERVVDRRMRLKKALRGGSALEPLHLSLSSTD